MFVSSFKHFVKSGLFATRTFSTKISSIKTFHDDFQGTRVFVQEIPENVDWKELKDHFKKAGNVVYASISVDKVLMKSKGCGIIQYETTDEAKKAIRIMNDFPLKGSSLFVIHDVQEVRGAAGRKLKNDGNRGRVERREARPSATTRYISKEVRNIENKRVARL